MQIPSNPSLQSPKPPATDNDPVRYTTLPPCEKVSHRIDLQEKVRRNSTDDAHTGPPHRCVQSNLFCRHTRCSPPSSFRCHVRSIRISERHEPPTGLFALSLDTLYPAYSFYPSSHPVGCCKKGTIVGWCNLTSIRGHPSFS